MNCKEFQEHARDYARGELPPPAAAHRIQCPECAAQLDCEHRLSSWLALAAAETAAEPPLAVERTLLAAFRHSHRRRRHGTAVWAVAAAAALLMIASFIAIRQRPAIPAHPDRPVALRSPGPESPVERAESGAATASGSSITVAPPAVMARAPLGPRLEAHRGTTPATARKTSFFTLRQPLAWPGEDLQMVRIRLPRREMRRFGMPVNIDLDETLVQAEVVLGEDGSARAVRFVH